MCHFFELIRVPLIPPLKVVVPAEAGIQGRSVKFPFHTGRLCWIPGQVRDDKTMLFSETCF